MNILNATPLPATGWGNAIGTGISEALNYLAQNKAEELMHKKQKHRATQSLEPLFGKRGAEVISGLPPELQKLALQNPELIMQLFGGTEQALHGQTGEQDQNPSNMLSPLNNLSSITQEQQDYLSRLANPLASNKPNALNIGKIQPELFANASLNQPEIKREQAQLMANEKESELANRSKLIAEAFTSPQEKREREKLELKRRQVESAEKSQAFKATAEERKQILEDARSAKNTVRDLNRLQELESEGKLDTPGYVEFLKRSGLDIPALMSPGSEEFNKIAQNFLRDAKAYYGGRVSNYEVEQFLKTVPSLSQSPEGRKRVIANLKNMANAKLAYADTLKEIVKENGGIPPLDLSEQIYERIDSKLDKLSEKFKEDLAKPSPEGQNKFITALQAGLGSIVGSPGKLLGSASHSAGALGSLAL